MPGHHAPGEDLRHRPCRGGERRGNDIGATTYGSIASILKTSLDKAYVNSKAPDDPPIGTPTSAVVATTTDATDYGPTPRANANRKERRC